VNQTKFTIEATDSTRWDK